MPDSLIVFVDSNILFSACYRSPNLFERMWTIKGVRIVTAHYCVEEVRRNLRPFDSLARLDNWLLETELVEDCPEAELPETLMLPAKDVPVLGVSVESAEMFRSRFPQIFQR